MGPRLFLAIASLVAFTLACGGQATTEEPPVEEVPADQVAPTPPARNARPPLARERLERPERPDALVRPERLERPDRPATADREEATGSTGSDRNPASGGDGAVRDGGTQTLGGGSSGGGSTSGGSTGGTDAGSRGLD